MDKTKVQISKEETYQQKAENFRKNVQRRQKSHSAEFTVKKNQPVSKQARDEDFEKFDRTNEIKRGKLCDLLNCLGFIPAL